MNFRVKKHITKMYHFMTMLRIIRNYLKKKYLKNIIHIKSKVIK